MTAADILAALDLPGSSRVDRRVPKKLPLENGAAIGWMAPGGGAGEGKATRQGLTSASTRLTEPGFFTAKLAKSAKGTRQGDSSSGDDPELCWRPRGTCRETP
jgi:hypothetical protein